jgi:hypothetical protein
MALLEFNNIPYDAGLQFTIKNMEIIVIRKKWYYKIIYPDGSSEIYFLTKSCKRRVYNFIKNKEDIISWINL